MRRLRPRGLPYVALGCAILATQTLKADTILFNDLPGLVTVSVTDPVREQVLSFGVEASVLINPPDGATLMGGGLFELLLLEPGSGCCYGFYAVSDAILIESGTETPNGSAFIGFGSADDSIIFTYCPGACIVENGQVQDITSVEWSDGTIDTIQFQSTEPAPEPSTLLLLCTAMFGVGATGRRKYFSRVFSNARTRAVSAARRLRS
jgi:hypothetical protein